MMADEYQVISPEQFARLVGVAMKAVPGEIVEALVKAPLHYRRLHTSERDRVLLRLLEQIQSLDIASVGKHRQEVWEQGWSETLKDFIGAEYDVDKLVPKYTKLGEAIRFEGDYAQPRDADFEVRLSKYQRQALFRANFAECARVYEFGCGTGLNLVYLSEILPRIPIIGLDWVESSRKLVEAIAIRHADVAFRLFNFFDFEPFDLGAESGVCTITALEQVGEEFGAFLEFLIRARPRIAVHIEPIEDMYNASTLFGYFGKAYHRKRRYLSGFLGALDRLEAAGRIQILQRHHTGFGIQRHDPFSVIVWRPA